jgi:iron only hydrogenase large subunit-like protein
MFPDMLETSQPVNRRSRCLAPLAKTYYADKINIKAQDMIVVSIMPCTAKKFEAGRPEMRDSGYQDVDYVLTTRELAMMIQTGRY